MEFWVSIERRTARLAPRPTSWTPKSQTTPLVGLAQPRDANYAEHPATPAPPFATPPASAVASSSIASW